MPIDDPYRTPKSALEEHEEPTDPLSRMEEGMVDYMAASRVRTIIFIVFGAIGCVVSLGGIAHALFVSTVFSDYYGPEYAGLAIVWVILLFHCALVVLSLWRYLTAINRVARTYDRQDLVLALRRRRFARVGWFVMIALFFVSLAIPVLYTG